MLVTLDKETGILTLEAETNDEFHALLWLNEDRCHVVGFKENILQIGPNEE